MQHTQISIHTHTHTHTLSHTHTHTNKHTHSLSLITHTHTHTRTHTHTHTHIHKPPPPHLVQQTHRRMIYITLVHSISPLVVRTIDETVVDILSSRAGLRAFGGVPFSFCLFSDSNEKKHTLHERLFDHWR